MLKRKDSRSVAFYSPALPRIDAASNEVDAAWSTLRSMHIHACMCVYVPVCMQVGAFVIVFLQQSATDVPCISCSYEYKSVSAGCVCTQTRR